MPLPKSMIFIPLLMNVRREYIYLNHPVCLSVSLSNSSKTIESFKRPTDDLHHTCSQLHMYDFHSDFNNDLEVIVQYRFDSVHGA